MISKVRNFIGEVISELSKVSWSTRQELMGATWVVIAMTLILAFFVGTEDFALSKLLRLLLK